jgi:hypothetical protein
MTGDADTGQVSATRDLSGVSSVRPSGPASRRSRSAPPARMSDSELARLRRKVDRGEPLILDLEAGALITEMMRATAAVKPAATTLNAAVRAAQERTGRELSYAEIQQLWNDDPGLRAVKQLHDRERARWRRANGILRESNMLLRGEEVQRVETPAGPPAAQPIATDVATPVPAPEVDRPQAAAAAHEPPGERRSLLRRLRRS